MKQSLFAILMSIIFCSCAQNKETMKDQICDPVTGICTPAPLEGFLKNEEVKNKGIEIIYVGDPMCSWCWGISKELVKLREYQYTNGGKFSILVGGLRPGGGDEWDEEFKGFLKHHWEDIEERTGQPFGNKLFELDSFNYDTEQSCRAVVAARPLVREKELEFFEAVQKRFYVDNEDPKQVEFYKSICESFGIDFQEFKKRFEDSIVKKETHAEFVLNRSYGVTGYPSILLKSGDQVMKISSGYMEFDQLKQRVEAGVLQLEKNR